MNYLTDDELVELRRLAEAASPAPWRAMIEGRDHSSGDSIIMVGPDDGRGEDLYLARDSGPASTADYDFIAAAQTHFNSLLDEIARLRTQLAELGGHSVGH